MRYRVFKSGAIRMVRSMPDKIEHKAYSDRHVEFEADTVGPIDKDDGYRVLAFKKDKNTVALFKSDQWDFVIPEDGEVIYNEHGPA